MDAIGCDQNGKAAHHVSSDAVSRNVEVPNADPAQTQDRKPVRTFSPPIRSPDRTQQQHLQSAAMDGVLRPAVAGQKSSRLFGDQLAKLIEEPEPVQGDAGLGQFVGEAKPVSSRTAVGCRLMPTPSGVGLDTGLVYANPDASLMQAERNAQPANTCPNDDDVHHTSLRGNARIPDIVVGCEFDVPEFAADAFDFSHVDCARLHQSHDRSTSDRAGSPRSFPSSRP
jgi:hypothetical protein